VGDKAQIAPTDFWALLVVCGVAGTMALAPTLAIAAGGRAAWMVALLGGIVGTLTTVLIGALGQHFPRLTAVGYAERLAGRWAGKVLGVILALLLTLNAAVDLRVALRSVIGTYFAVTPSWAIALLMAATALSVCWSGPVHMARLAPLLLAGMALTFLSTFPFLWHEMRWGYLSPLLDLSPLHPERRAFWEALGAYRHEILLAALLPYLAAPQRAVRSAVIALACSWGALLLTVLTPIVLLGPAGAAALTQPFPFVVAAIRIRDFPLERVEMLARLAYNLSELYVIAFKLFCGGLLLSEVFGTQRLRPFLLALTGVALLPVTLITSQTLGEAVAGWTLIASLLLTSSIYPLLWLLYWLRRPP